MTCTPLLESGILLSALVAVILNAFFNGVSSGEAAKADASAAASPPRSMSRTT